MGQAITSKRRWIFLPFEIKARELYGKTLFACFAAESGWGVILGRKSTIREKQAFMPKGTFIEKNIDHESFSYIKPTRAAGNLVSAWNEEGLIYINQDLYKQSIDPRSFRELNYYFAWGDHEAEDIAQTLSYKGGKIIKAGNPRFDLLRPELRAVYTRSAGELKEYYGNVILLNTNFSPINRNLKGYDHLRALRASGRVKTLQQEDIIRRYQYFKMKIFECFLNMLPVLSEKFNSHTIVVRPHPSENHTPWLEKTAGLPNVKIIYERSADEWIQACDVMIHNNCTTGVESFLMEKPSISYRPYVDETVEYPLTNLTSFQATNLEELVALVQRFINKKEILPELREERLEFARRYIANLEGKFACETIVDTLDSLDLPEEEGHFLLSPTFKEHIRQVKYCINLLSRSDRYKLQKFPGIFLGEINNIISEIQKVSGRFNNIQTVQLDKDVFCIYCL